MRIVHYLERWLEPSMGFVHDYVVGSRHPGIVVSRHATVERGRSVGVPVLSLRALERGHRLRGAALDAVTIATAADALHVHFGYVAPDVIGVVRRRHLPLIVSMHGEDVTALPRRAPGFYDRVAPITTVVVSPSAWLADRIAALGFASDRIVVVPSGVDTSFFTPPSPSPTSPPSPLVDGLPTVGFVGRLVEKKGVDVLLAAWPQVRAAVDGAELQILGDGPLARTVIDAAGRDRSITWIRDGGRDRVRDVLRSSSVIATPSRTAADGDAESLLIVNLEAAACGRPVVSTTHGGIPEYVRAGETGLLVREGDADALAGGLIELLRDPAGATAMGERGRRWALRFDVATCTGERDDAVERAVAGPPRRAAAALPRRPDCSVILPTRDRPAMLERALSSIRGALAPGDELIVIDSASAGPETAAVAHRQGARVVRCERPGVNRARNAGWRAARNEALLYVDDDVTVDRGWADGLAGALAAHPEAAFVAGRIEIPPGQEGVDRPVAVRAGDRGVALTPFTTGVIGHSASLAVRRSALAEIGGWDEALGAGGRFKSSPEVDLFDRLFAAGWEGWYELSAVAWHDQWRRKADLIRLDWRYSFGSGARIAKLLRTDRRRARRVAREVVWQQGLREAVTSARRGYKTATLLALTRVVGASAGLVRALPVPVEGGVYRVTEAGDAT